MVMERGAAVRRVADDGMPEPGRIRRRLRVNWRERRRHVVDSLLGRTEELELGSRMSATPLVGTAPLAAVPTATCVGSVGTRGTLPLMRNPP